MVVSLLTGSSEVHGNRTWRNFIAVKTYKDLVLIYVKGASNHFLKCPSEKQTALVLHNYSQKTTVVIKWSFQFVFVVQEDRFTVVLCMPVNLSSCVRNARLMTNCRLCCMWADRASASFDFRQKSEIFNAADFELSQLWWDIWRNVFAQRLQVLLQRCCLFLWYYNKMKWELGNRTEFYL